MLAMLISVLLVTGAPTGPQDGPDNEIAVRQPKAGSREAILQTILYRHVAAEFDATPARDAFGYLADALGENVIVRYMDDTIAHGIDPDTPITMNLQDVPALVVLEEMLEQCGKLDETTWQLRRGYLEIGTKDRLSSPGARELRTYSIEALLFEPPMFDNSWDISLSAVYGYVTNDGGWGYGWRANTFGAGGTFGGGGLGGGGYGGTISPGTNAISRERDLREAAEDLIDSIRAAVEPDAWRDNGGEWATIRFQNGALIVRAPDFIHREINGYPRVPPPPGYTAPE